MIFARGLYKKILWATLYKILMIAYNIAIILEKDKFHGESGCYIVLTPFDKTTAIEVIN